MGVERSGPGVVERAGGAEPSDGDGDGHELRSDIGLIGGSCVNRDEHGSNMGDVGGQG
jgi:hypothetical protein